MHRQFARLAPSFALLVLVLLPAQGHAFAAKPDAGPTDTSSGEAAADAGAADKKAPPPDGFVSDPDGGVPQEDVQDPGGCASSADCGSCAACVNGQCQGLGVVMCKVNADCVSGQVCEVNAADSCKNQCVTQPQCQSDAQCPKCTVCAAGSCKGLGVVQCMQDKDCSAGQVCSVVVGETCKNACVAKPAGCKVDGECGPCAGCVAGECKGLGAVVCTKDSECAAGQTCKVDANAACKNQCVAGADAGSSDVGGAADVAAKDTSGGSDAAGALDGTAADAGGKSVAPQPAKSDGCSARPVGASPWAWLVLMLGLALVRRRLA